MLCALAEDLSGVHGGVLCVPAGGALEVLAFAALRVDVAASGAGAARVHGGEVGQGAACGLQGRYDARAPRAPSSRASYALRAFTPAAQRPGLKPRVLGHADSGTVAEGHGVGAAAVGAGDARCLYGRLSRFLAPPPAWHLVDLHREVHLRPSRAGTGSPPHHAAGAHALWCGKLRNGFDPCPARKLKRASRRHFGGHVPSRLSTWPLSRTRWADPPDAAVLDRSAPHFQRESPCKRAGNGVIDTRGGRSPRSGVQVRSAGVSRVGSSASMSPSDWARGSSVNTRRR